MRARKKKRGVGKILCSSIDLHSRPWILAGKISGTLLSRSSLNSSWDSSIPQEDGGRGKVLHNMNYQEDRSCERLKGEFTRSIHPSLCSFLVNRADVHLIPFVSLLGLFLCSVFDAFSMKYFPFFEYFLWCQLHHHQLLTGHLWKWLIRKIMTPSCMINKIPR